MNGKVLLAAAAAALALAGVASAQNGLFQRDHGKLDPPSLLDGPPAQPPPEGVGPAGVDFGQWRSANPQTYGLAFQARMRERLGGKPVSAARADLAANGFSCQEPRDRSGLGPALDCRLAVRENGCDLEWWVVLEDAAAPAKAGRDAMCARRS